MSPCIETVFHAQDVSEVIQGNGIPYSVPDYCTTDLYISGTNPLGAVSISKTKGYKELIGRYPEGVDSELFFVVELLKEIKGAGKGVSVGMRSGRLAAGSQAHILKKLRKQGWKTSSGKRIKHPEQWEELGRLVDARKVHWNIGSFALAMCRAKELHTLPLTVSASHTPPP